MKFLFFRIPILNQFQYLGFSMDIIPISMLQLFGFKYIRNIGYENHSNSDVLNSNTDFP